MVVLPIFWDQHDNAQRVHETGFGVRLSTYSFDDGELAEAIDRLLADVGPRTRLLAVSHVYWTTGVVLDVHALERQTGLPVLVDGAQSVGAVPVDVGALDFYTVSGQKWLCGPDSTGALYVADPDALSVARPSYFAQKSFEPGGRFVPKPGAQRFDSGWIPMGSVRGLTAALDTAPAWRFERIAEITALCREAVAVKAEVVTPPGQAGLVTFRPDGEAADVAARLFERGVVVRDLPGTPWVRASCGWWTNEEDIQRLVAGL
jgi:L-cysteine/cystine lyase